MERHMQVASSRGEEPDHGRCWRGSFASVLALTLLGPAVPIAAQGYTFSIDPVTYSFLGAGRTVIWDGVLSPSDDGFADIPIGFNFQFQGTSYSTVRVSSNGYLTFGSEPGGAYVNTDLPDAGQPNGILCPWWDDLLVTDYGATDQVSYEQSGTVGLRTLTVQWASVSRITDDPLNYSILNFQVRLREDGDRVEFDYSGYGQVGAPVDCSATVGIEHPSGASATVPVLGSPVLGLADWPGPNVRITFTPGQSGEFVGTLCPGTYTPLALSRTTLFLGSAGTFDDDAVDIPIGFTLDFYGVPQTTLRVSTNGYATFPPESGLEHVNDPIPSPAAPNKLLAPWWDDLIIANFGGTVDEVSYEFFGFIPGAAETTIEWRSVSRFSDGVGAYHFLSFQIHLYEDGNRIEFHYGPAGVVAAPGIDFSASLGLEDATGTIGFAPFGASEAHRFAQFPASGTIICFEPSLLCGDCNLDSTVGITDALQAAQHGVGIIILSGTNFVQCNVNGTLGIGGVVDVLDALSIARYGVGLDPSLPCSP